MCARNLPTAPARTVVICFFPGSAVGDFVFLPDATMVDANFRHAADGTYFAPVLFGIAIFIALMFMFVFHHHNILMLRSRG
ncbi:hypothetical protein KCP71_19280 [Salmonella enterica subsp. enterica]|nr:hypothetical protein KCP71_19280 [Salmonella enterica subsp. enterica]